MHYEKSIVGLWHLDVFDDDDNHATCDEFVEESIAPTCKYDGHH